MMSRNRALLRAAWRALRSRPRYALLVALLFAVGIGATVAVFSVMRATLLADTGYRDAGRLVHLWSLQPAVREDPLPLSIPDVDALRAQARSLDGVITFRAQTFTVSSFEEPASVHGLRISPDALRVLGLRPATGRDFVESDATTGAPPVAVISSGYCIRHFAMRTDGSCDAAGQSLTIDGLAHEVVGVLPREQRFAGIHFRSPAPEIWVPLRAAESERAFGRKLFRAIARLAPGASPDSATRELQAVFARLAAEHPQYYEGWSVRAQPLADALAGRLRTPLYVALLAALLLLATACINAVSLTVTRHIGSLSETAVRAALGASPRTLLKEQVAENGMLAAGGLAGGVVFAFLIVAAFRANASAALGDEVEIRLEWGTLLFAAAAALFVVTATTLATWLLTRRLPLAEYLKDGGKGAAGSARRSMALPLVIILEFAMALALLVIGVGLFAQLTRAQSAHPGFDVRGVWVATFNLPAASYPDETAQQRFLATIAGEFAAQPGIDSASGVARAPMIPGFPMVNFTAEGSAVQRGHEPIAHYRPVTHEYFDTLGMPLRDGRAFTEADRVQAADVVIVSESLAAAQWPGAGALGRRIQVADERTRWRTVVGVVADARLTALDVRPELAVYVPLHQNSWPNLLATACVVFRTERPAAAASAAALATRRVDSALPRPELRRLDDVLYGSIAKRAFLSSLIFAFACIATLLALLGVYGAFEFLAVTRSREVAIRRALGAQPVQVVLEAARRTALLLGCAAALGSVLMVMLLQLAEGFVLDWTGGDTTAVVASVAVLTLAALLASCIPLRGAIRRPIAVTLREAR